MLNPYLRLRRWPEFLITVLLGIGMQFMDNFPFLSYSDHLSTGPSFCIT